MGGTFLQWVDRQGWVHGVVRGLRLRALAATALRIWPWRRRLAGGTVVEMGDLESFFLVDEIFGRATYREALERAAEVRTVVDLGCNVGFFCCYLRSFYKRSDFAGLGIDANPALLKRARRNLDLNGLGGIALVEGLVGAEGAGEAQAFHVYASHLGSSQFEAPEEGRTLKGGWETIRVPVVRAGDLWRAAHGEAGIDLLKVDIEGSEGRLLRSDAGLFGRARCVVMEWHKWLVQPEEIFPVLRELGFTEQRRLEEGANTELWFFAREGKAR